MLPSLGLTMDMVIVLGILTVTIVLFVSNIVRIDIVAMFVLVLLGLSRLLPPEQLFSGFSSDAVISVIAIMIISAGLENTGISFRVARWMLLIGRDHPHKILFLLMLISGFLASFMRSLGTVALLLPVAARINARTGISKSFLLLPIAFCAILGGMMTMVGTGPLIILNSLLKNSNQFIKTNTAFEPFNLFYVLPIGGALLLVGIIYLLLISRKLTDEIKTSIYQAGAGKKHFLKTYGKGGNIFEVRIEPESCLIGKTLKDLELMLPETASAIALIQNGEYHFPPLRRITLKANNTIAIMGAKEEVKEFSQANKLIMLSRLNSFTEVLHPVKAGLCESVIPPSSQLIGKQVKELHMKRNHKLHVLGIRRGDKIFNGEELNELTLRSGDTLGIFSQWEALDNFSKHPDFFVLTNSYPRDKIYPKKTPFALFFFFISIMLVVLGGFPISIGLLLGAAGMITTGVLSIDQAYSTVSWKTVFLLAGLIPLGLVLQSTGTAEWMISYFKVGTWNLNSWLILAILSVLTTLTALIITNIGATVLLVPVAIDLATSIGSDPKLYALVVALSASNTFIIPTHQVNALIAGPGNYTLKDFIHFGGGMTIIFIGIILGSLYLFY